MKVGTLDEEKGKEGKEGKGRMAYRICDCKIKIMIIVEVLQAQDNDASHGAAQQDEEAPRGCHQPPH